MRITTVSLAIAITMTGCVNTTTAVLDNSGSGSSGSASSTGSASGSSQAAAGGGAVCRSSDQSDFKTAFAAYRSQNGLAAMSRNGALERAASTHSADIAPRSSTSHTGSDGSRMQDRAKNAGYRIRALHENIAQVQGGASAAIAQWDASPTHKAGLLGDYNEYGIACVPGPDGYDYWTLKMGRSA